MLKVIIADDHAMMREGLRRIIDESDEMTTVGEACDGVEVLEVIKNFRCDLLLMDMSMPGMHGVDLIKEVGKIKPALPILVMSMHDTGKIAAAALKAGANGYITKNTDPERFPAIIMKVAGGGRYVDPVIANNIIFEGTDEKPPHESLSKREKQLFHMIVSGKPLKQIADELYLSPKTVSTHKKRIMEKMDIQNDAGLVRYSFELQLKSSSTSAFAG